MNSIDRERWQSVASYQAKCTVCEWLRIEQFRRDIHRFGRAHANESGHVVELRRQQFKVIEP